MRYLPNLTDRLWAGEQLITDSKNRDEACSSRNGTRNVRYYRESSVPLYSRVTSRPSHNAPVWKFPRPWRFYVTTALEYFSPYSSLEVAWWLILPFIFGFPSWEIFLWSSFGRFVSPSRDRSLVWYPVRPRFYTTAQAHEEIIASTSTFSLE